MNLNCRISSIHDHSLVHRFDRRFVPLLLGCLLAFSSPAIAHPMHFHLQPLDAKTVERTLDAMERMVAQLEEDRGATPVALPEGALGVAVLSWVLPRGVVSLDEATLADSELLNETLAAAGYEDSETAVQEWKIDAERILEAWEVLSRDLDMGDVDAAYLRLAAERERLELDELLQREAELLRDETLVLTTLRDLELIEPFGSRIAVLLERLGVRDD